MLRIFTIRYWYCLDMLMVCCCDLDVENILLCKRYKIFYYIVHPLMVIIIDPLSLSEQTLPVSEELLALALWQSEVKREYSC